MQYATSPFAAFMADRQHPSQQQQHQLQANQLAHHNLLLFANAAAAGIADPSMIGRNPPAGVNAIGVVDSGEQGGSGGSAGNASLPSSIASHMWSQSGSIASAQSLMPSSQPQFQLSSTLPSASSSLLGLVSSASNPVGGLSNMASTSGSSVGASGGVLGSLAGTSGLGIAGPSTATHTRPKRRRTSNRLNDELKCRFCPRRLPDAGQLVDHETQCVTVRAYECQTCAKRFKTRTGLHQHHRIHTQERPYACHYCDKSFTQKSHVDQHERIHTGIKPYECQFCGRQFRQRSQQQSHELSHLKS